MAYFSVMVEANSLLVQREGSEGPQLHGCFCTRYVEADDSDMAVYEAKKIVMDELGAQGIVCSTSQLVIESVEQISGAPNLQSSLGQGFTFFLET